jgi:aspartyl-tRNA(Asn)/glutamyl-tRNA(Gln) amidotransferase subunit C
MLASSLPMPSPLAPADVVSIAALARLDLTPDEITLFSTQLAGILEYVDMLKQVDTTGVAPTSHPVSAEPVWREDRPSPSLDRDTVVSAGPSASVPAGLFKVPKVL